MWSNMKRHCPSSQAHTAFPGDTCTACFWKITAWDRICNIPTDATAYLFSPLEKLKVEKQLMSILCYNLNPLFLAISNTPLENNLLISCLHHEKVKTSLFRLNLSVFSVHFCFFLLHSGLSTFWSDVAKLNTLLQWGFIKLKAAEMLYQFMKFVGFSIKTHMGEYKLLNFFFFLSVSRGLREQQPRAKPAFLHSRTGCLSSAVQSGLEHLLSL